MMIIENDRVDIHWADGSIAIDMKVLHVPCSAGDMWYFENTNGDIIAQNPASLNLDSITKRSRK
jgi:hypothetical protein